MAISFEGHKKLVVALFLLTGVAGTFAYKLQGSVVVDEGQHHKHFFHPYIQSFTMFMGEALCLLVFAFSSKPPIEEGKAPHKPYIFFIPALSDCCSSILQYMGLAFIPGSTYVMFKGAAIITTAIFSKILVKMVIERRHIIGCALAIVGLVIVGGSGYFGSDDVSNGEFVGYILMLCSLIFNGFFYAYEQRLLKMHTIHPLEMVGYEGCFGLVLSGGIITALSFVPCSFGESACVYDEQGNAFMQLPTVFWKQFVNNPALIVMIISGIIFIGAYNFCGVSITKIYDALTRSLLNITKTSLIWIIGIAITIIANSPDYNIQSLDPVVNVIKAFGFFFIVMGTLIYNQLIFKGWKFLRNKGQERSLLSEQQQIS